MKPWEATWRVGRSVLRTLYEGEADAPDEKLIGLLDTPEQARLASAAPDAVALLLKHEWKADDYGPYCIECNTLRSIGHRPDCELDIALRKAGVR